MDKCSYCGAMTDKPKRVGPELRFCNKECYALDCIKKYPGTPLAVGIKKMYPEYFAK